MNRNRWKMVLVFALFVLAHTSCRSRVCTSHFVCQGYSCRDLLCLTQCKDNSECDQIPRDGANNTKVASGYVCQAGACVCDKAQPDAYCHRQCFKANDCNSITDPKTNQVMATKNGFVCHDPTKADLPGDTIPGQCVCPAGAKCQ